MSEPDDFFDEARIFVAAGNGGDGTVHFRREKYVPLGGPDGGDGGKGGSVSLRADPTLNTLHSFRFKRRFVAAAGSPGTGNRKHGRQATDIVVPVPAGTIVMDDETREHLADLQRQDDVFIAARGGQGGLGNQHFATSTRQAPGFAEKGEPGEERWLRLELKLLADVGLVGLPNAGKSTLLASMSAARPKIADYPFTTLTPNLGVVALDDYSFVAADIPGLIEGAHEGHGLGDRFLRHIERTRLLVRVLDASSPNPEADFDQVTQELRLYDAALLDRPQIIVLNKLDLPDAQVNASEVAERLRQGGHQVLEVSGVTRAGIPQLITAIRQSLFELGVREQLLKEEAFNEIVFTVQPNPNSFTVERKRAIFHVHGRTVERMVSMTDMESGEGIDRLQRQLKRLGVFQELERAGVGAGSRVNIGGYEMVWEGELEPGINPRSATLSGRTGTGSRRRSSSKTGASRGRRPR